MFNRNFNMQFSSQPSGTLQSQGLFHQPPVPNFGTPQGTGVADGRAYTRTLQPGETAEHRLNQMTAKPSEYMQNASRRGLEMANSRGMLNSSMASGASMRAALESAMPIAEADAGRAFTAGSQNLDAMNQNLMQERDIANRVLMNREGLANAQSLAELDAMTRRYGIDIGLLGDREGRAYEGEQRGLDRAHDYGMTGYRSNLELNRMGFGSQLDDWREGRSFQRQDWMANRDVMRNEFTSWNDADRSNWMSNQNFSRDYLSSILASGIGLTTGLLQRMYDDPDMYPPDVVAGLEGFTRDMFGSIDMQGFEAALAFLSSSRPVGG